MDDERLMISEEKRGRRKGKQFHKRNLLNVAITAIIEKKLLFLKDIEPFIPCTLTTFNNYFPTDSIEKQRVQEEIQKNRINIKIELREKMRTSNDSKLILSLYRLIATKEEKLALISNIAFNRTEHKISEQPLFSLDDAKNTKLIETTKVEARVSMDGEEDEEVEYEEVEEVKDVSEQDKEDEDV